MHVKPKIVSCEQLRAHQTRVQNAQQRLTYDCAANRDYTRRRGGGGGVAAEHRCYSAGRGSFSYRRTTLSPVCCQQPPLDCCGDGVED